MRNFKALAIMLFIAFAEMLGLQSCTFTTTRERIPEIKSKAALKQSLDSFVTANNINIDGDEIKTNGKLTNKIIISITNGVNIPADDSQLNELAENVVVRVRNQLVNPAVYDTYEVSFIERDKNNPSSSTFRTVKFELKHNKN